MTASIQRVTHRCNERSVRARGSCQDPATGSACKGQGNCSGTHTTTHAHTQARKRQCSTCCSCHSTRNVARQPAHSGLQMTSSLEYQLVAQHPHYALAAPTMYLRQLIFCLHGPHTPRVEEPHPATLCRTRNSTDDSMLSTGQKIMHKTPCIRSANPKQQLPKSVDN